MEYDNQTLMEAFTLEYHAREEANKLYLDEVRAHALTRCKLKEYIMQNEEFEYIMEASKRFLKEAGMPIDENIREHYKNILAIDGAFKYAIIGKGFIVGFVSQSPLEPSKKQAMEIAWFVEKEYRGTSVAIKLLKEYERICKSMGANYIGMACLEALNPDSVEDIYKRLGYEPYERHYRKVV